jgi:hypothetical protein
MANSSTTTTVVVYSTTYYHVNPWYREVIYEGEEGKVLTTAPVGWETDELPAGSQSVQHEGTAYSYADGAFYQAKSGGGWVVVQSPVGAEVKSIPEDAVLHNDEGDIEVYQFDRSYWSKVKNDAGETVYRVEPPPPAEEIDEIPAGSTSFVADGETYYYVDYNWYVAYDENGKQGYTNGEPDIDAQVVKLPEGVTELENDGVTYYQFDSVYFEQVDDADGTTFYQVVDLDEDDLVVVGRE